MPITINGSGTVTGLSVGGLPDGSINNADLATDAVSTSKLLNGAVTTAKLGSAEASGLCKAWVNFNGTGVVAIRASYNVSSITDNGVGAFTVNLTTALADTNAAPVTSGMRYAASVSRAGKVDANIASTTTVRLFTGFEDTSTGPVPIDLEFNHVAIFR